MKKVLIGVGVVVVLFVVVVMVQPGAYHVERSTQIEASPEVVWAEISDFNQWKPWNPWEKMDPNQKTTITGTPGTVGHASAWEGEKTGKGTMTMTEVTAPSLIRFKLEVEAPMQSVATTALAVKPTDEGSEVTWSMDGKNGFMGKFFGLVMGGMDKVIGTPYEEGLGSLKGIAEKNAMEHPEESMDTAEGDMEDGDMEDGEASASASGETAATEK